MKYINNQSKIHYDSFPSWIIGNLYVSVVFDSKGMKLFRDIWYNER